MSATCGSPTHSGHAHDTAHGHETFDGGNPSYRRALFIVIGLNAGMFAVEIVAGGAAESLALWADALDFAADAATYAISLWAIGRAADTRSRVALAKGYSLAVMALLVLGAAAWRVVVVPSPEPAVMGWVGFAALAVNVVSALLLYAWRDGDANVMSVWLCTRNDAIGNVAVMLAAAAIWLTATPWPDIVVAVGMASLFLTSSLRILRRSRRELASRVVLEAAKR